MRFQLVSAYGVKFDQEVFEVLVPTQDGPIAIAPAHMPLISAASPGVISIRKQPNDADSMMEQFAVSGGIIQVNGRRVRFLSDDVTAPEEVSVQQAEEALARAQALMRGAKTQGALHEAKRLLHHSSAKLRVAKLRKRRHY